MHNDGYHVKQEILSLKGRESASQSSVSDAEFKVSDYWMDGMSHAA